MRFRKPLKCFYYPICALCGTRAFWSLLMVKKWRKRIIFLKRMQGYDVRATKFHKNAMQLFAAFGDPDFYRIVWCCHLRKTLGEINFGEFESLKTVAFFSL